MEGAAAATEGKAKGEAAEERERATALRGGSVRRFWAEGEMVSRSRSGGLCAAVLRPRLRGLRGRERGGHGSNCRDDGGQERPLNGGGTTAEGQPPLSLALFSFLVCSFSWFTVFFLGANLMVRVAKGRGVVVHGGGHDLQEGSD
ncbi:integrase [Sesbania bispinosa]|nr:integrase [Sesbania bispinosa]